MTTAGFPKYESYKESGVEWIGKFPQHWKELPLKHLSKIHAGNGFPIELQGDYLGTIPFLKVSDFQKGMTFISKAKNLVSKRTVNSRNWNIVPSGSLVTAKIGEALRQNHRNIVEVDCVIDNNCIAFEPQSVEPIFFFYLHKLIDFDWFVNPGAVPSISVQKYRSQSVVLPPLPEQRAIAAFLDNKCAAIDEAVRIQQAQIALLQERRQILIQQAVTRGLNPNVPLKDSGIDWIGQIPAHWEVKRLKHLTRKVGSGITPTGGALTYVDDGIPLLRSQNILFGRIDLDSAARISSRVHSRMSNSIVHNGDVLLNITGGSIGRCHFVNTEMDLNVNQHVCIIRPNHHILSKYLNLLLSSTIGQKQIWISQQGGGREGLNFESIKAFVFTIPPITEQTEIAEHLEQEGKKIDTAITLKNSQITALKEYKTVLINATVTGKIKVI